MAKTLASPPTPIPFLDLADDLAHMDLADRLQRFLEGDQSVAEEVAALARRVPAVLAERENTASLRDVEGWGFGGRG